MIDVKNLNKKFGENHVLKDINEHIEKGEKVVIVGPSCFGKEYLFTVSESDGAADFRSYYRGRPGYYDGEVKRGQSDPTEDGDGVPAL